MTDQLAPIQWDDDAELEFERAINRAWLEWHEQLQIRKHTFEGAGSLSATATVIAQAAANLDGGGALSVEETVRERTGVPPGHPRALSQLTDQLIADARTDLATFLEQHQLRLATRGVQKIAVGRVIEFLKLRGVAVNEEKEFRTILRRVVKGEDYKYRS
jgi:hypothetical protein